MRVFFPIFRTIQGHVLVYCMYWYPAGHPIGAVPNFELGYHVSSHRCWYIMYHPKFRVGVLYTIPGHVLVYSGPKSRTVVQDSGH